MNKGPQTLDMVKIEPPEPGVKGRDIADSPKKRKKNVHLRYTLISPSRVVNC